MYTYIYTHTPTCMNTEHEYKSSTYVYITYYYVCKYIYIIHIIVNIVIIIINSCGLSSLIVMNLYYQLF